MYGYVYQPKSKRSLYGRLAYPPQREFFVGKPGAQSTATAQETKKGTRCNMHAKIDRRRRNRGGS